VNIARSKKRYLGVNLGGLEKVNCLLEPEKCRGVKRLPTWVLISEGVEKSRFEGYLDFAGLKEFSGCGLGWLE